MSSVSSTEVVLTNLITCDFSFNNLTLVIKDILNQLKRNNERCTRLEAELSDKNKQILVLFDRLASYDGTINSAIEKVSEFGNSIASREKEATDQSSFIKELKKEWTERTLAMKGLEARMDASETVLKAVGDLTSATNGSPLGTKLDQFDKSIADSQSAIAASKVDLANLSKMMESVQDGLKKKADYTELQAKRETDQKVLDKKVDLETVKAMQSELRTQFADRATVELHTSGIAANVRGVDERLTGLQSMIDRLGVARVQNDHAAQLSELTNQLAAMGRQSTALDQHSKDVNAALGEDRDWKKAIAERVNKIDTVVNEKADRGDLLRKTDVTDFQNRTSRLDTIKADKTDVQTLVNHCLSLEKQLAEVSAPLSLLVNARKRQAGARLSPSGLNSKLNLNIPFGAAAGGASGTSSLASLNSATTSASAQKSGGAGAAGSGGIGKNGKFSLSGLLASSLAEKDAEEKRREETGDDPENPFSVLMPLLDADRWAPKAYVDPLFQDLYEKLGQLALNTEGELRRFASEVRSLFDSLNTNTSAAAGKVHFRCLTCDSVVNTLKGPHSRRMAVQTAPQNMAQIGARQMTEIRIGGAGATGDQQQRLLIESGEAGFLYGADGNVYKARDDDITSLLPPNVTPQTAHAALQLQHSQHQHASKQSNASPRKVTARPQSALLLGSTTPAPAAITAPPAAAVGTTTAPLLLTSGGTSGGAAPNSARKPAGAAVGVRPPTPTNQSDAFAGIEFADASAGGAGDGGSGGADVQSTPLASTAAGAPVAVTSRSSKLQKAVSTAAAASGGSQPSSRPQTAGATPTPALNPQRPASSLGISSPATAATGGIAWIETPSYGGGTKTVPNT